MDLLGKISNLLEIYRVHDGVISLIGIQFQSFYV